MAKFDTIYPAAKGQLFREQDTRVGNSCGITGKFCCVPILLYTYPNTQTCANIQERILAPKR